MSDLAAVDRLFVRIGSLHRRHGSATLRLALDAARQAISRVEEEALRRRGEVGPRGPATIVPLPGRRGPRRASGRAKGKGTRKRDEERDT